MTISELKPFEDHKVVLQLKDGECLTANVRFVDTEYEDIIVDILETNQPQHYSDRNACYTVAAGDILSARISE